MATHEGVNEATPLLATPSARTHYCTLPRFLVYQVVSLLSAIDGFAGTWTLTIFKKKDVIAAAYGASLDYTDAFFAGLLLTGGGALAGAVCVSGEMSLFGEEERGS
jgi:hypothetical protein